MNDSQKMERINKYYKATVIRNPLERLISAFRDKLQHSPTYKGHPTWPEEAKVEILRKFGDVGQLKMWQTSNGSITLRVTFPQFIQWVVETKNDLLDRHFAPQTEIIYPCSMVHDFFGNFKQIGKDMELIIKKLHAPMEQYRNTSLHAPGQKTVDLLEQYYSQVSKEVKHALFRDLYQELDFYYHLYPEERTSHCKLLETDELIQWWRD